ncbi:MAG: ABC-type polysaccharide/polyol phosphate export system, permease component [Blastococcus sp.]|jgi:ABC transporter DrrB family efflux protein|nr:ABC-type polysaccharide/polyol phosphate export system, permease component [Blastococcus sp.]
MTSLSMTVADGLTITRRNLIKVKRVPDLIVFATLSPIMFVLLFRYVFGGAINVPGDISYAEFLLPGIFAQTVVFGSTITGASLADDLQKGLIDRFRSLPMAHSAVLVGRTVADLALNALSIAVMALTGLAVGWRIHTSVGEAALGFLVLLGFAYAVSWLMALVGLIVRTPEVVNNASFIVIFPITFVANTFVPLETFPSVLRHFAEWNPVSSVVQAARNLFGNSFGAPDVWSLQHPVLYAALWGVAILAVFVPLSVRTYRSTASR